MRGSGKAAPTLVEKAIKWTAARGPNDPISLSFLQALIETELLKRADRGPIAERVQFLAEQFGAGGSLFYSTNEPPTKEAMNPFYGRQAKTFLEFGEKNREQTHGEGETVEEKSVYEELLEELKVQSEVGDE